MTVPVGLSVFSGLGRETSTYLDAVAGPFESLWLPDHLQTNTDGVMEGWTTATYCLARYPGKLVGHQVLCNEFRSPALLAKMAATAQVLSEGRFVLGLGAGWHQREAGAYGIDFFDAPTRLARLVEALDLIRLLWRGRPVEFSGSYYTVSGAECLPRPDPVPPVMVGASGEIHGLAAVAAAADWWNLIFRSTDEYRRKAGLLERHCEQAGRDPREIMHVLSTQLLIAESDRDVRRLRERDDVRSVERNGFAGTPETVFATLCEAIDSGAGMVIAGFADSPRPDGAVLFSETVLQWMRRGQAP